MVVKIPKHNALVPFAERRKINMKKRKNLGKKLVTMLVSVGFFCSFDYSLEFNGITSYSRKE